MRAVIQRAASAEVSVDSEVIGKLDRKGLVVLLGVAPDDTPEIADQLAKKIWTLRIFEEEKAAEELNAPILVVSQFTLFAKTRKGRRPSWHGAAPGEVSEPMINYFVKSLKHLGAEVHTGKFGANMLVSLINDGPITIVIDTANWE